MIIYLIFIIFFPQTHQDLDQDKCSLIYWENDSIINWDDFLSYPDSSHLIYGELPGAVSVTYIKVSLDSSDNYKVNATFDRSKSWSRFKTKELLSHEQGHYDITEIFARDLRKLIEEDMEAIDINKAYTTIVDSMDVFNHKYDRETGYGSIDIKSKIWKDKIHQRLDDLKDYRVDNNKNK